MQLYCNYFNTSAITYCNIIAKGVIMWIDLVWYHNIWKGWNWLNQRDQGKHHWVKGKKNIAILLQYHYYDIAMLVQLNCKRNG